MAEELNRYDVTIDDHIKGNWRMIRPEKNLSIFIDEYNHDELNDILCAYIGRSEHEYVGPEQVEPGYNYCIDLSNVDHITSPGLATLITFEQEYRKAQFFEDIDKPEKLSLIVTNEKVYDILQITRLNKRFDIYTSLDDFLEVKNLSYVTEPKI
jgi:anti-anti-sigma regulatory factor